jgi:Photosynthesis system II assembly factor YCF48
VILRRHALATKESLVALQQTRSMPNEDSKQTQASDRADQIVARSETQQPRRRPALGAASAGEPRDLDKLQQQTAKTGGGSDFGAAMLRSQVRESGPAPDMVAKAAQPQAGQQLSTTGRQEKGLPSSQAQMPAASETVQVESAGPVGSTEQLQVYPGTEAKDFAPQAPPPESAPRNGGRSLKGNVGGSVISRNETVRNETLGDSIMPRWTLSSDGTLLLRSFDYGKTWQSIPVAGRVVFRALSALGPEVWIGGSAGALYHSSDSGQHWQKVEPTGGGRILVADIIALEFTDPQHGKLTTANHEIWITADAGQSWQPK